MKRDSHQPDQSNNTEAVDLHLNPIHVFENFVVGESNKFAFRAAKSICELSHYNPLYIQGEHGTGKTHLLHAIGHTMQIQGNKIIRTTIESFLGEFMQNLSNKTMDRFKNKYRECDLLLIEDFQYIQGKHQTQQELFHIFEALLDQNKQIVITSLVSVNQMADIEEGLKKQIQRGLEVNIQRPDIETRAGIIQKIAKKYELKPDDEIINYIARKIEINPYQIEGIMAKIHAYRNLMQKDVTIEFVQNIDSVKNFL